VWDGLTPSFAARGGAQWRPGAGGRIGPPSRSSWAGA